jgi:hypothetical protein
MRDLESDFVDIGALFQSENFIDMPMDFDVVSDVLFQTKDEEVRFGVGLLAHLENVYEMARVVNVPHVAIAVLPCAGVATSWSGDLDLAVGQNIAIDFVAQFSWKTEKG